MLIYLLLQWKFKSLMLQTSINSCSDQTSHFCLIFCFMSWEMAACRSSLFTNFRFVTVMESLCSAPFTYFSLVLLLLLLLTFSGRLILYEMRWLPIDRWCLSHRGYHLHLLPNVGRHGKLFGGGGESHVLLRDPSLTAKLDLVAKLKDTRWFRGLAC